MTLNISRRKFFGLGVFGSAVASLALIARRPVAAVDTDYPRIISTRPSIGPDGEKQIDILIMDSINRQIAAGTFGEMMKKRLNADTRLSAR